MQQKIVIAGLDPAIHRFSMSYWIYILASASGGTLYVGVTNDLVRRVYAHREDFADRYSHANTALSALSTSKAYDTATAAIQREKNVKHWSREWKIELIVRDNPLWRDLYEDIVR